MFKNTKIQIIAWYYMIISVKQLNMDGKIAHSGRIIKYLDIFMF